MSEPERLAFTDRNPDVLTCIANLSNDEVFTPPDLANDMLDAVAEAWAAEHNGADIWSDSTVRFLDPFTKSGVFLREITKRLIRGLANEIPDLQERADHILTRQVYGIALTELTSLLARRSVYCSKWADSEHSVVTSFEDSAGNIWYERTEHKWVGGRREFRADPLTGDEIEVYTDRKCVYCGGREADYARAEEYETHAYAFTHNNDVKLHVATMFGEEMQFDVIIGNPPYQLSDGGGSGSSARPIYNDFVEQAKKLDPQILVMIIPSRWFAGGKGLDGFRSTMLGDRRLRRLVDFPDSREVFAGVDVAGGVCYFVWDRNWSGKCAVETVSDDHRSISERFLDEYDVFIRDNRALAVVEQVSRVGGVPFADLVSSRRPFGLDASLRASSQGELILYSSSGDGHIDRADVPKGAALIDRWKVLVSKTSSEHAGQSDRSGMKRVLSRIEVMPPGSVSTESYLVVGPFESEIEASNAATFLRTRFARFLISSILLTQNITRSMFRFLPVPDLSRSWTDEAAYDEYRLTTEQIRLIESTIKQI